MRRIVIPIILAASVPACTPLGLWIYQEPTVEVTSVRLDPALGAAFPVQLAFAVSNANDFEVSLVRVHVRFSVGGSSMIDRDLSTAAAFAARDRQVVHIGVAPGDLVPGSARRLSGTHPYTIEGFAVLKTPIGERRIPFARAGAGLGQEIGLLTRTF